MQKKWKKKMDTGVFNQKAAHLISRGPRSESWKQDAQKYLSLPRKRTVRVDLEHSLETRILFFLSNYKLNHMHV